ncbi:serine/threonine-protein kinase [Saccharopolyspora griseoalba]|uniref:non-specific serine/threonine protein kinase n=1 Tax=Saccharopolyspora griseoalba TaxID=1431848 RepID=A0ABW2LIP9_9PSEU
MSEVGTLLAGRYRLERRLGSGGMGVVWLATDERLQRQVAVKELHAVLGADPAAAEEARQRAMREGRIAGRLNHPNAIAVHDVTEQDGLPVLVMEYLPSRSLADVLNEQGPMAPEVVARIGAQAAAALAAAHEAGVVHRDIKPANVLIGEDGTVKITDFGISHAADDISVTKTGVLSGTPAFLAPEIARGQAPTPSSDVYSLGSTLYTAVEGEPPFGADAENSIALLHQVAAGTIRRPRSAGPLTAVLNRMLEADPARRPAPAQAREALQAAASGRPPADDLTQPMAAIPPETTAPTAAAGSQGTRLDNQPVEQPARRRKPAVVAGVAAAVVLIAGILLVSLLTGGQEQRPNRVAATPAEMERVVADYYALLPEHTGNAWNHLGPQLQAEGRARYDSAWEPVRSVSIYSEPTTTGRNTVQVGVELVLQDGTRVRELHRLGMLVGRGTPRINTDGVLSSETTAPPPPPAPPQREGDDEPEEKKDEEKGKGNSERKGEEDKKGENG